MLLIIAVLFCPFVAALPLADDQQKDLVKWMQYYGYMPDYHQTSSTTNDAVNFFKLIHNVSDMSVIRQPRCGNPDFGFKKGFRVRRSSTLKSSDQFRYWNKPELLWDLSGLDLMHSLKHEQIKQQVKRAINDWAPHLPFKLRKANFNEKADIRISFEYRDHGDGYEFDGPGGVVGHAFAPLDGRVHIDADEIFTDKYDHSAGQFNLRFVVAHEIGHAIGLTHSTIRGSIMFPFYFQLSEDYKLSIDDRNAVRALYGLRRETSNHRLIGVRPWCTVMLDAAATGPGNVLYIFEYDIVFAYKIATKRATRIPIHIMFQSLDNNIMAAVFSEASGHLYFFKGWQMWKFMGNKLVDGYPRVVEGELAPFNPHGAIYHRGQIFLLKGNILFRFDEVRGQVSGYTSAYPVDHLILGAPHNISRLFTHRQNHFILTEHLVYVYDAAYGAMLEGYPRKRTSSWMLC